MLVGYARVSTNDQDLSIQLDALRIGGCDKIFSEKLSGMTADRPQLVQALDFVREGDVLVVTRLDRFARSSVDLHNLIQTLSKKAVGFRCIEQNGVDTTSSSGKLMLGLLGAVAEFELALRSERQREGIARAKLRGIYKGRRPTIDSDEVRCLAAAGVRPVAIAKQLGIGRASVYRLMREREN